jgi:hypothetical protein
VSALPELGNGESAVAYFNRLREALKSWGDPTGVVGMTHAASVAALAVADRNEAIQRALLAEVRALNQRLDKLLPPGV